MANLRAEARVVQASARARDERDWISFFAKIAGKLLHDIQFTTVMLLPAAGQLRGAHTDSEPNSQCLFLLKRSGSGSSDSNGGGRSFCASGSWSNSLLLLPCAIIAAV